jgi:hypothetical protein
VLDRCITLRRIERADLAAVGEFLHTYLNQRLAATDWAGAIAPPWEATGRDSGTGYGFLLEDNGDLVGTQLLFSSVRDLGNGPETVHNLGALCLLPQYRNQAVRLIRAALGDRSANVTDLSPSGTVVPLNERFGFRRLDTSTALVAPLPLGSRPAWTGRTRIIADPEEIARRLNAPELEIFHDHRAARAAHHLIVERGTRSCYLIWRHDRRKRLPMFASLLFASDPDVLRALFPSLSAYLLVRHRVLFVLAELRIVGMQPRRSLLLRRSRPKMFRSSRHRDGPKDYLYSELTCVPW